MNFRQLRKYDPTQMQKVRFNCVINCHIFNEFSSQFNVYTHLQLFLLIGNFIGDKAKMINRYICASLWLFVGLTLILREWVQKTESRLICALEFHGSSIRWFGLPEPPQWHSRDALIISSLLWKHDRMNRYMDKLPRLWYCLWSNTTQ